MKNIFLSTLVILFIFPLNAQEVVLDMDVEDQYKGTRGPNMRHYTHFYIGTGFVMDFDEETGTRIDWWKSNHVLFGYRYKLKLLSFYALGLDLNFMNTRYYFEGRNENPLDPMNPLTYNLERDRHHLHNTGFGLEFYHRINIGRRGNTLGYYLDTGIRGQWNMGDVEKIIIKTDDKNAFAGVTRIKNRKLGYVEPLSYGLTARIGFNKIILHGFYRLSEYFTDRINDAVRVEIPELPRLTIGIQYVL